MKRVRFIVLLAISIVFCFQNNPVWAGSIFNPYTDNQRKVMPSSYENYKKQFKDTVSTESQTEQGYYWDGSLDQMHVWIADPENKYHRVWIKVTKNKLIIANRTNKNPLSFEIYSLNLRNGVITVIDLYPRNSQGIERVSPEDVQRYAKLIEEMFDITSSAYDIAYPKQKTQIQPVIDYLKRIESSSPVYIPITDNWYARQDEAEWNDSRGIIGVDVDTQGSFLILHAALDADKPNYGKGELYIYVKEIPELGQDELDMNGKKLVIEVFIPVGFVNDPKSPEHLRLFLKSADNWAAVYGIWRKVDYEDEGTWITLELDPLADPASWKDISFDPTRVWELGLAITKGSGQYYGDGIKIKNIRLESTPKIVPQEPLITQTPPINITDFISFSGRNLNFEEYNYGWCVGEFPAIWGEGEHGGFSNPTVKENLRQRLLYLKSQGISTVRLMALFGDLRTGILQDKNGNFIYDKKGNLQFDKKVYDDVKAFLDVLHETGMKAVIGLFDFRVADEISREGQRNSSWLVGEHPEIFTNRKAQDAFVRLFTEFFSKLYSKRFVDYNINDVVLFWEVMNEPESVCAVDFKEVLSFHDRFFALIRKNTPRGTKVTTSSLSVDSAFRFWKDKVDVISVHHYPDFESLTLSDPVGNYGFGNKPVFWTEFGDVKLTVPDALTKIYASGSQGLLFWKDNYYQFSEEDYRAWVEANRK